MIEKAKERLSKGVPHEFIINDLLQNALDMAWHDGKILSYLELKEEGFKFCMELSIPPTVVYDIKAFYPSKKILDDNRVYHGDCRDILPLLKPNNVSGILTDFPYGINFQSNMRTKTPTFNKILSDEKPFVDQWIKHSFKILKDGGFFVTFYRWDVQDELFAAIHEAGFDIKSQIVWIKGGGGMGDLTGSYAEGHELAIFCTKGKYEFPLGRPNNIYKSNKVSSDKIIHPNEKPIDLMKAMVRDLSRKGDLIVDPFSGSGCVCAAAVSEGRRAIGIELDDRQVPLIGCNYIEYGNKRIIEMSKTNNQLF